MISINLILIFILILILFIIYININNVYVDSFIDIKLNNISYNVIHMKKSNQNKYNNILNIEKQINQKINIQHKLNIMIKESF